jgi:Xaa-Pro aminopeptidase
MSFLSRDVFAGRIAALRALMERRRLDAVAVLTAEHWEFLTGHVLDVRTWERPVVAVFPRQGEPFVVMHELSTNGVRMAKERGLLWVDDVTLYAEHPRLGDRLPLLPQWPELVASLLAAHGLDSGRIGADTVGGPMARAAARLPELSLIPVEADLRELRWVKTTEELDLLRAVARLSDFGQERYREMVRPGRLVQELDLALSAAIAEEAGRRFAGERVEYRVISLSGPDSAAPHGTPTPTGRRFAEGDGIVNIIVLRLNGMTVENERTWFLGPPSERQAEAFEVAREAQEACIAELVAGRPVSAFDAAALAVFERKGHGGHVLHRAGHGVGLAGHEFPEDTAFNHRPLRAGEVYSAEPGIYIYGLGGFRHDDTVIVGERAPEVVTAAPRDLASLTIPIPTGS